MILSLRCVGFEQARTVLERHGVCAQESIHSRVGIRDRQYKDAQTPRLANRLPKAVWRVPTQGLGTLFDTVNRELDSRSK